MRNKKGITWWDESYKITTKYCDHVLHLCQIARNDTSYYLDNRVFPVIEQVEYSYSYPTDIKMIDSSSIAEGTERGERFLR